MRTFRLPRGRRADITIAAVVGLVVTASIFGHAGSWRDAHLRDFAMSFVAVVALVFVRRYPFWSVAVAGASTALYYVGPFTEGGQMLSIATAIYLTASRGQRLGAYGGSAVTLLVFGDWEFFHGPADVRRYLGIISWVLVVLFAGEITRYHRAYLAEARRRVAEAERTVEEEGRRKATEERLRIARELHDVLAHNISLINVQAGAALHRRDPEQAYAALAAIKDASKDTLRELRTTLGVLRQVDEEQPLTPAPSLDNLESLIVSTKEAGLRVELTVAGERVPVPSPVDLVAYRIVQEALTNAVRHAGDATATILLEYAPGHLVVEIGDDGSGPCAGEVTGNGLRGMHERAASVGGLLTAGPRPDGGFLVRASLPL